MQARGGNNLIIPFLPYVTGTETIAVLTAMHPSDQLPGRIKQALVNRVTPEEIGEVITHLAFYGGWPVAMTTGGIAQKVFEEEKL